jgi:glycosyltransferase involved in cell wall biosynthesis
MHGPTEFYAIERFNLARKVAAADTVVCISDFCRSQLMLLSSPESWEKLIVVHCGADLARYRYRAPRTVDDRELKVVCVGRMVARKGQAVLLDAIKRLSDAEGDAPRISLTLVGSGPAEEHLRAQAARLSIEDRVRFVGAVGQDEMPHVMDTHDVFCLVSLAEGVPVVLMEAMAVGLPVVTTPIAGIPELVDDEESGLLVPPGRPDALAGVLARLAADAGLRERLSHTARKRVEADFDSGQCASQLAQAFAELAQVPISLELVQGSGEQNLLHDL